MPFWGTFTSSFGSGRRLGFLLRTPRGQQEFITPGSYTWTAPEGVESVCVVCVGGGGGGGSGTAARGGGGGGLGWKNDISVIPGQTYTVVVGSGGERGDGTTGSGSNGGDSYFIDSSTVAGLSLIHI